MGVGRAHGNTHQVSQELCTDQTSRRLEGNLVLGRGQKPAGVAGETAGSIATHIRLTAVGIVVAHAEICLPFSGLNDQYAIGAYAAMAFAKLNNGGRVESKGARQVVEQDEVVACAIHFSEGKLHG